MFRYIYCEHIFISTPTKTLLKERLNIIQEMLLTHWKVFTVISIQVIECRKWYSANLFRYYCTHASLYMSVLVVYGVVLLIFIIFYVTRLYWIAIILWTSHFHRFYIFVSSHIMSHHNVLKSPTEFLMHCLCPVIFRE